MTPLEGMKRLTAMVVSAAAASTNSHGGISCPGRHEATNTHGCIGLPLRACTQAGCTLDDVVPHHVANVKCRWNICTDASIVQGSGDGGPAHALQRLALHTADDHRCA